LPPAQLALYNIIIGIHISSVRATIQILLCGAQIPIVALTEYAGNK